MTIFVFFEHCETSMGNCVNMSFLMVEIENSFQNDLIDFIINL